MSRSVVWGSLLALGSLLGSVQAAPLSVRIEDHDFSFDVPYQAVYDYDGAEPDHLSVHSEPGHFVMNYTYTGALPPVPQNAWGTPPAASADPYPLYSGEPILFAANMDLDMYFSVNDGPYTNPNNDTFEISLVGNAGHLTITGWIATQGFPPTPLYPSPGPGPDIVLLDVDLLQVTLLARDNEDRADLIEGVGLINTLLGVDLSEWEVAQGATFFKFIAPLASPIFPVVPNTVYEPSVDYGWEPLSGRVSGEAGAAYLFVPEPATLGLVLSGGVGVLLVRRRRG